MQAARGSNAGAQWRNGNLFSSLSQGPTAASVAGASTIPNRDARNIPLRVELSRDGKQWQDEVLMIHQGSCWVVDDVRYMANPALFLSPLAGRPAMLTAGQRTILC